MTTDPFRLVVSSPGSRALDRLPAKVAAAAVELITGPLLDNPRRLGAPLRGKYEGLYAARRGELRIRYAINEQTRTVEVLDVDHRRDAYH